MKLTELVKLVPQSAMAAKYQASAQPVLILKEDSIKIVNAQLASLTMVMPFAKPATHFARLAQTLLHVLHASLKTTEAFQMANVSAHQDSTK
jgi:hypothetical protein